MLDFEFRSNRLDKEQAKRKELAKKKKEEERKQNEIVKKNQEKINQIALEKKLHEENLLKLNEELRLKEELETDGIKFNKIFHKFFIIKDSEDDKILLPEKFLIELNENYSDKIFQSPIIFELKNNITGRITHVGVKEFSLFNDINEENSIGLPYKVYESLFPSDNILQEEFIKNFYNDNERINDFNTYDNYIKDKEKINNINNNDNNSMDIVDDDTSNTIKENEEEIITDEMLTNNIIKNKQKLQNSLEILLKNYYKNNISINLRYKKLTKCKYLKLLPLNLNFFDVNSIKKVLEGNLKSHSTITLSDILTIWNRGMKYKFKIIQLLPEESCSLYNTDVEIEFDLNLYENKQVNSLNSKDVVNYIGNSSSSTSNVTSTVSPTSSSSSSSISSIPIQTYTLPMELTENIEDEPSSNIPSSDILVAKFKLPNGKNLIRKFFLKNSIKEIFKFLLLNFNYNNNNDILKKYIESITISTRFPSRQINLLSLINNNELNNTIESYNFNNQENFIVTYSH